MKKYRLISLGCPKNLTDAEEIAWRLDSAGYSLSEDENSEIVVINTCAFLRSAARESEGEIENCLAMKRAGKVKKIIVSGCLVEREKEKLLEKYPEIDGVIGVSSISRITDSLAGRESYILPHVETLDSPGRARLTLTHSAYLKIADGCDNRCSYCTIPSIRGPFRSKPLGKVAEEASALAASGAKEISLIAQDTSAYGRDTYGRPALKKLVGKLSRMKNIKWLRLMYMYPDGIDSELLRLMRDSENFCRYLEMPLQHFSDGVLRRMNRRYTGGEARRKLELVKKYLPEMAVRTTFIAGFPGETEKDFRKLEAFVREGFFTSLAVFRYSREKGTPAFSYPGQIPAPVRKERYLRLLSAQASVVDGLNRKLAGKEFEILMDSAECGRTYMDAPDIDGRVEMVGGNFRPGEFVRARITQARGYVRKAAPSKNLGPVRT